MIKYVKEIKANSENLTSLLVSHIDDDRLVLKKHVEESLRKLIKETLIQKNGENYSFLTNEEQDINRSIALENVATSEIIQEASSVIFEEIYTEKKYRFSSRYNFGFNKIVDTTYFNNVQSNKIGVRVITPYSDLEKADNVMRMVSSQQENVIICLPEDTTFLEEISESLKIKKFITKQSSGLSKNYESIKIAKQNERLEKKERIKLFIEEALKHADIYINGDKANVSAKDPASRIDDALGKLVGAIYNKLSYMETAPTQTEVIDIFNTTNQNSLNINEGRIVNKLALTEVTQYIEMNSSRHIKTSLKSLINHFSAAPYGFVDQDVEWLIATLFKQGQVAFTVNNRVISLIETDKTEILKYLTKREFLEKLLIEKREKATEKQIKSVKLVAKELFRITTIEDQDDELIADFKSRAQRMATEVNETLIQYQLEKRYPGKSVCEKAKRLLSQVEEITYPIEFFALIDTKKDEFLDISEEIEPIQHFFTGEQKTMFKKACEAVDIFDVSKTYIVDKEIKEIIDQIRSIILRANPYDEIYKTPELLGQFREKHINLLENEAKLINRILIDDKKQVFAVVYADELNKKQFSQEFSNLYENLSEKLNKSNDLAAIKNIQHESEALKIRCLNEIEQYKEQFLIAEKQAEFSINPTREKEAKIPAVAIKRTKNVTFRNITSGRTVVIEKESDIDKFLVEFKANLVKELEKDTIIKLFT